MLRKISFIFCLFLSQALFADVPLHQFKVSYKIYDEGTNALFRQGDFVLCAQPISYDRAAKKWHDYGESVEVVHLTPQCTSTWEKTICDDFTVPAFQEIDALIETDRGLRFFLKNGDEEYLVTLFDTVPLISTRYKDLALFGVHVDINLDIHGRLFTDLRATYSPCNKNTLGFYEKEDSLKEKKEKIND